MYVDDSSIVFAFDAREKIKKIGIRAKRQGIAATELEKVKLMDKLYYQTVHEGLELNEFSELYLNFVDEIIYHWKPENGKYFSDVLDCVENKLKSIKSKQ